MSSIRDYGEELVSMARRCSAKGKNRAVFLDKDGNPNKRAREIGEKLNDIGGIGAMRESAQYVLDMKDRIRGDASELEWCWDGIGSWRA